MVRSDHFAWQPSWVSWVSPTIRARQLEGGDALAAQDSVDSAGSITLFLRGASTESATTREVWLDVEIPADGETAAGLVPIEISVVSSRTGSTLTRGAEIRLIRPESHLLDYLPGLYREKMMEIRANSDPWSEPPFFERYLLGFEDVLNSLRETLDNLDQLFGPYSSPPNMLLWLAAWVMAPYDENWPEIKRRKLIEQAVEIFRWRGTKRGLIRYLEIYAQSTPEIEDQPIEGMRLGPLAQLNTTGAILGDISPHTFLVTLTVDDPKAINEETVREIINYVKPAHTAFSLRILKRTSVNSEAPYVN